MNTDRQQLTAEHGFKARLYSKRLLTTLVIYSASGDEGMVWEISDVVVEPPRSQVLYFRHYEYIHTCLLLVLVACRFKVQAKPHGTYYLIQLEVLR